MPEYLAPGVYVEETTFRQKTIEGVSTSTAGFIGPTRFGPVVGEPSCSPASSTSSGSTAASTSSTSRTPARRPTTWPTRSRLLRERRGAPVRRARLQRGGTNRSVRRARHRRRRSTAPIRRGGARPPSGAPGRPGRHLRRPRRPEPPGRGRPGLRSALRGASAYDTVLLVRPADPTELYWLEELLDTTTQVDTFRLRQPGQPPPRRWRRPARRRGPRRHRHGDGQRDGPVHGRAHLGGPHAGPAAPPGLAAGRVRPRADPPGDRAVHAIVIGLGARSVSTRSR